MNRRGFLLSSLVLSAVPAWAAPDERFARGLLWRVSKKGVAPSHVFGTIHVADPRLSELPPAVRRAFGGAKSLMLEFMPDAYSKERFLQAALFLDDLTRDLAAIWELREKFMARHSEIAAHQAVMTKRVVHDRSVVMAFRMQRELRRGAAFVALGALHLYGDKGVLALLEEDGYRSTRVY